VFTRRAFIRISCLFPFALQLEAKEIMEHTVEVRDVLMGTFVQIKGLGVKKEILSGIVAYMKHLEHHFSRFEDESELSVFNREGAIRRPSKEFCTVMENAKEGHRQTRGVFDVTVLPVLLHFQKYRKVPTQTEKLRYRERMGTDRIEIHRDIVYSSERAQVTLDAVAKGYIIDQGAIRLMDSGCMRILVNIGGDMYCGDKKGGWDVGIYDPIRDSIYRKLSTENRAVCTSGSYVNYYTEDKKLHHIVDPGTLTSPNDMVSVTVTASTACRADLLSTALFVAGPQGKEFLRDGENAYFITQDGREIVV
jgi:FAD:protein FMN transferase